MVLHIAIAVLLVLFLYYWVNMKPKNFPPGPPCIPILGSLPFIPRKHIHLTISGSWLERYGPIVGLMLGSKPVIAVGGPREVIEVLRRDEFLGREDDDNVPDRNFHKRLGIIFSDGPVWVEQRRFALRHLKDFGFGKKSSEAEILAETEELLKEIRKKKIVQATGLFTVTSINILWSMTAGTRYAHNDADFKSLLQKLDFLFRNSTSSGSLQQIFPFLKRISPAFSGHNKLSEFMNELKNFIRKTIHEHKLMLEENNPRDLMDIFLHQMESGKSGENSAFTEEGLIVLCLDLFSAGAETTSNTLSFCLLYMVLYPKVQEAVQKELDTVIGHSRRPSLEDRVRLPYVEATIAEISRINTTAPLAVPHKALEDTELGGYTIKKNTPIIVNLWSVLHDREHWGDPEVFRPERFIDTEGKFIKDEWMIQFGVGKRVCLGDNLARNVLFLVFSTLMQECTFRIPEGDPKPSTFPLSGLTTVPAPFRVEVLER